MLDYAQTEKQKEKFILGYDIFHKTMIKLRKSDCKEGQLYFYASFPNVYENEALIRERMENQVWTQGVSFAAKESLEVQQLINNLYYSFLMIAGGTELALTTNAYFNVVFAIVGLLSSSQNLLSIVDGIGSIRDVLKNVLFLANKEKFSDFDKNNEEMLSGLRKSTKKMLKNMPKSTSLETLDKLYNLDDTILNINSIDDLNYNELKKILENIESLEETHEKVLKPINK